MQPTLLTNAARAVCTWLSVRQVGRGSFDFVSHIQTERGLHLFFRRQRSIPLSPEAYLTQVRHRRHICTAAEWTEIRGGEVGGWGWGDTEPIRYGNVGRCAEAKKTDETGL